MLKDAEIFIVVFTLFLGVIFVFNARWLVKKRFKSKNENRDVNIVKWVSYIIIICSLIAIKYIS